MDIFYFSLLNRPKRLTFRAKQRVDQVLKQTVNLYADDDMLYV